MSIEAVSVISSGIVSIIAIIGSAIIITSGEREEKKVKSKLKEIDIAFAQALEATTIHLALWLAFQSQKKP